VIKKWQLYKPNHSLAQSLAQELKISPATAQVLINRGINSVEDAAVFLKPRLANLRDPMEIPNIAEGAKRVLQAKEKGEQIVVFGDYDVDGVTGTAILLHTLKFLGIPATYYIPHRYDEGYGMSTEAIKQIAEQGAKLIITVDCGISNVAEVKYANSLGIDVIITDHHNVPKETPPAYAIVNPKLIEGNHPSRNLSGAGVAFKFVWVLLRISGIKDSKFLTSLFDLASLGTISDVVPLTEENRIIAMAGLGLLSEGKRLGIKYLKQVAGVNGRVSVNHIYFGLAPRINAAGRLKHASKAVDLMLTDDVAKAEQLSAELHKINTDRQGIGSDIKEEVFSQLSDEYVSQNKLVMLSGQNWHPGVIGIVASQIVDRYVRPTVLVSVTDGVGRGSARSIEGINIFEILDTCRDLFTDFGGHSGAAGFEIKAGNLPAFSTRVKEEANKRIPAEALKPIVRLDLELEPKQISLNFIKELEILDPHGEANPRPTFLSRNFKITDMRQVGKTSRHLKLRLDNGTTALEMIGFGLGELAGRLSFETDYDVVYHLETNEWNGFENAQLLLIDIRESEGKR